MEIGQFTHEQIVSILQQAERGDKSISALCREQGIADVTLYRGRKRFAGMDAGQTRRLKELEKENARLKALLAERDLKIDAVREFLAKNEQPPGEPGGGQSSGGSGLWWIWVSRSAELAS